MAALVTLGAIREIAMSKSQNGGPLNPVFQVLAVKQIAQQPGTNMPSRYRIVLSDTVHFCQSMLSLSNNSVVEEGRLQSGCLVRLGKYVLNTTKGQLIIVVLDLEILDEAGVLQPIGAPTAIKDAVLPSIASAVSATAQSVQTNDGNGAPQPQPASTTSFYGIAAQPSAQPERKLTREHAERPNVYPIEALSPYQSRWTIKARVTYKSEIKHWHNQRGEGKLFTVHLLDESGEIRATAFNDQVDAYYDLLQEGAVYYMSKCRVNIAKKQFTNISNEYELMFERDTLIEKAPDQMNVPQVRYQFVQLADVANVEKDSTIDVIAVLKEVHELGEVTSKTTQKAIAKRELTLVDQSNYQIRLTIWGKQAQDWSVEENAVLAFKGVKVNDFSGRSLSMFSSSQVIANPDIPEAHELKGWFDAQGRGQMFLTYQSAASNLPHTGARLEDRKTLSQIKDDQLGMGEMPDYFSTKATIVFIKSGNVSYPACPSEGCNKKIVEDGTGAWRCERCDKSFPRPQYRYIMHMNVHDHTGQEWFDCFDDVARRIMGVTADELHDIEQEDLSRAAEIFVQANCKSYIFRCRGKQDNYNGQVRVKYQVVDAHPLAYAEEAKALGSLIQSYG